MYTHIDLSNLLHLIYCIYIIGISLDIHVAHLCCTEIHPNSPGFSALKQSWFRDQTWKVEQTSTMNSCAEQKWIWRILWIYKYNHWSIDLLYLTKISTIYDMIIEWVGMWSHHCDPNSICWYDPVEQVGPLGMSYRNSSWVWSILSYSQRRVR